MTPAIPSTMPATFPHDSFSSSVPQCATATIKIGVVALAGAAVYLHQQATSRRAIAAWGAIGALASVAALCLGVLLAG